MKRRLHLPVFLFIVSWSMCMLSVLPCRAQIRVAGLRTENLVDPVGIGAVRPRLSWVLAGEGRGVMQAGYALRLWAVGKGAKGEDSLAWDTGRRPSDQSAWVEYTGPALSSGRKYAWRVRVWDARGKVSAWSEPAYFRMGLLAEADWAAKWIGPGYAEADTLRPCPLLRREFVVDGPLRSATLYITAHGLYEARINGKAVGNALFTPGWTRYDKRLQYQAYDVSGLLRPGKNATGVMIGDGWWRGLFGPFNIQNNYGKDAALLFQLVLEYKDGRVGRIVSDGSWTSSTGPVRYSDLYNGEVYSTYWERPRWTDPGYADGGWQAVKVLDLSRETLVASVSEPVRRQELFRPLRAVISPKGERILDFGQNLAGRVRVRIHGKAGDTIRISHAEWLDAAGNFYTGNLRAARAEDVYILHDDSVRVLEPHFTFHGFRYIKVEGWRGAWELADAGKGGGASGGAAARGPVDRGGKDGRGPGNGKNGAEKGGRAKGEGDNRDDYGAALDPADFEAVALYSDMERTGVFHCSDSMINRLQQNIQWSQQSNFLDIPSDCPQRSERLGWTGDAQIFASTAAFNRGVANFFSKWLRDVAAEQGEDGGMSNIIPNVVAHVLHVAPRGAAGWGDASVILPWTLFQAYGDTNVLRVQYPSMRAWVEYVRSKAVDGLWTAKGYGDWYAPGPATDLAYIDQCFFSYSSGLLARIAGLLGKTEDAALYARVCEDAKAAFLRAYLGPGGRVRQDGAAGPETQTDYVLPLFFEIVPDSLRAGMAVRLAELVHANRDHLATGFLGTPYLLPVLSRYGYGELAFTLLKQQDAPSWLYPITRGATTIWEKWDAVRPDGSQDTCSMNHYAYGAVGDWLYRYVAGLDQAGGSVGYRHSRIAPHIGGGLKEASAALNTPYGLLSVHWRLSGEDCLLDIRIPANTRSTLVLPCAELRSVIEGGKPLGKEQGHAMPGEIESMRSEDGRVMLGVGSGEYRFRIKGGVGK